MAEAICTGVSFAEAGSGSETLCVSVPDSVAFRSALRSGRARECYGDGAGGGVGGRGAVRASASLARISSTVSV